MKKVIVYTENYVFGGLERFLFDFVYYYKENNKFLLIFNSGNARILDFAIKNGIEHKAVKIKNLQKEMESISNIDKSLIWVFKNFKKVFSLLIRRYWYFIYNYLYLRTILKNYNSYSNIYIVNGGYPAANTCRAVSIVARQIGFKNIVHVILSCPIPYRNLPIIKQIEKLIDTKVNQSVSVFQVNSNRIKNDLIKMKIFDSEKIKIVYTGVSIPPDTEKINIIKIGQVDLVKNKYDVWLGMVAFLGPLKGHRFLIEAMKMVNSRYNNIKCLIVGEGPEYNNLFNLSRKLKLTNNIIFVGKYNDSISNIYKFIDIFVFCSMHEGLPYSISEAMSYKLPIISTNVGGIPEQIDDGINGYLVEKANSHELANKIINLVEDKEKWKEMGERSYRKIKDKFIIEVMLKDIDSILV